jgi:tricarboxylate carrier
MLSRPRWDQSTYTGRVRHFAHTTNPLHCLASNARLDASNALVKAFKLGVAPRGTTLVQIWTAQHLVDSAFHPQTQERVPMVGRMAFQPLGNSFLGTLMLTSGLRSTKVGLSLQYTNQAYMATLNYCNRNSSNERHTSLQSLAASFGLATGGSFVALLGMNIAVSKLGFRGLVKSLVPMWAVGVATAISVPVMRATELRAGIRVETEDGTALETPSRTAAKVAIASVCLSRVLNACGDLVVPPLVMYWGARRHFPWATNPRLHVPMIAFLTFTTVATTTPLTCAILPQRMRLPVWLLEPHVRAELPAGDVEVYFNKGL